MQPSADAAPLSVEVRGARGELLYTMMQVGPAWEVHLPGDQVQRVTTTAEGAVVRDATGTLLVDLAPGPAGHRMVVGDKTYRVTFPTERRIVHVLDDQGVTVFAVEQRKEQKDAVKRDSSTRQVARALREPKDDKVIVEGRERVGTVHRLEVPERELASLLLLADELPIAARAALCAYWLSR